MSPSRRMLCKAVALAAKVTPAAAASDRAITYRAYTYTFGRAGDDDLRFRMTYLHGFADGSGELIIQGMNSVAKGDWQVPEGLKYPNPQANPEFPMRTLPLDAAAFTALREALNGDWCDQ